METMTHVLSRTVYGLDLFDLPLTRLAHNPRHHRPHHSRTSGIAPEASLSRSSIFIKSIIPAKGGVGVANMHVLFGGGATPPNAQKPMHKGKQLKKSATEVHEESPLYHDHPSGASPPRHTSLHGVSFTQLVKEQRSVSTAMAPLPESLEMASENMRSLSTDVVSSDVPSPTPPAATPSLCETLPTNVSPASVFSPSPPAEGDGEERERGSDAPPLQGVSARAKYQRLVHQDSTGSDSMVVSNPCASSLDVTENPEEGEEKGKRGREEGEGAGGLPSRLGRRELGGSERQLDTRQRRRKEGTLEHAVSGLVLENRDHYTPEPDGLTATPTTALPTVNDFQEVCPIQSDLDQGVQRSSRYRGSGSGFRFDRSRGGDFLSQSYHPEPKGTPPTSPIMHKSSSESNLQAHRIQITVAGESSPPGSSTVAGDNKEEEEGVERGYGGSVLRRATSSGEPYAVRTSSRVERKRQEEAENSSPFVTSIISVAGSSLIASTSVSKTTPEGSSLPGPPSG